MRIVRLTGYLLLNMAVSAAVAVVVLLYWENNRKPVASRAPDEAEDRARRRLKWPARLNGADPGKRQTTCPSKDSP